MSREQMLPLLLHTYINEHTPSHCNICVAFSCLMLCSHASSCFWIRSKTTFYRRSIHILSHTHALQGLTFIHSKTSKRKISNRSRIAMGPSKKQAAKPSPATNRSTKRCSVPAEKPKAKAKAKRGKTQNDDLPELPEEEKEKYRKHWNTMMVLWIRF